MTRQYCGLGWFRVRVRVRIVARVRLGRVRLGRVRLGWVGLVTSHTAEFHLVKETLRTLHYIEKISL